MSFFSRNCVCPSVSKEQLGLHWTDFHEIWYLNIFRKYVEKAKVSLKSDTNNGYSWIENYLHKSFRETQNTCYVQYRFFFNSCRLWDNVEKYGTADQASEASMARAHWIL